MSKVRQTRLKQGMAILATCSLLAFAGFVAPQAKAAGPETKTIIKHTAIGALGGAVLGGTSDRQSASKGAVYGGMAGLGSGLINNSDTMQRNDGLRRTTTGAVVGAGVGASSGKGTGKGALFGAGAGLGWHLLDKGLNND